MRLLLEPCTPTDVDQLTHLSFATIASTPYDPMLTLIFGHDTPQGHLGTKRAFASRFSDPHDTMVKLTSPDLATVDVRGIDPTTGESPGETSKQPRILGMANWKVYPRYVPENPMYGKTIAEGGSAIKAEQLKHLPTHEECVQAAACMNMFRERRRVEQKEPHLQLMLLMVDEEFRRQGLGKILMDWGDRLADSLGVSCWVESSEMGKGLYQKHGYVVMRGGEKWKIVNEAEGLREDAGVATWVMRRPERGFEV